MRRELKTSSIIVSIIAVLVLDLIVALTVNPFPREIMSGSAIMIIILLSYNTRSRKKNSQDDIPLEDERTIQLKNKYNFSLLFWFIIGLLIFSCIMLMLFKQDTISIKDLILYLCLSVLGIFVISGILSRKK
ncbi:hypothetical protein D0U04_14615 [Bacillus clarus]|uniref:Putative membrane protein n=1 Tax=Bacillus clarus TaxID=2338372 RepID=A0A090YV43_9BACI|nr:hypothetical protein [Bacillus clarus]KFN02729.1 putative membrane protein [Bacillus clarus]RFT66218.1 hypothetical protein D0U04_14615 [Bacillus clarus]